MGCVPSLAVTQSIRADRIWYDFLNHWLDPARVLHAVLITTRQGGCNCTGEIQRRFTRMLPGTISWDISNSSATHSETNATCRWRTINLMKYTLCPVWKPLLFQSRGLSVTKCCSLVHLKAQTYVLRYMLNLGAPSTKTVRANLLLALYSVKTLQGMYAKGNWHYIDLMKME